MESLIIQDVSNKNSFELYCEIESGSTDYNCLLRLNYEYFDRTIKTENIWNLCIDDFVLFYNEIENMAQTFSGQAKLCTFDNQSLTLLIDEMGHVTVDISDGVDGYNGYVHFVFDIDQSYLPGIMEQVYRFCGNDLY